MWVCTNWAVDWNAIAAVATALATLTALGFGLHDPLVRLSARRTMRRSTATATIHPLQMGANQCRSVAAALEDIGAHAGTLNAFGEAIRISVHAALERQADKMEVFGDNVSAKYCYAISLIEDVNTFADWLSKRPAAVHPGGLDVVREAAGFARESAQQAATALDEIIPAIREHVPEEILLLRFGPQHARQE